MSTITQSPLPSPNTHPDDYFSIKLPQSQPQSQSSSSTSSLPHHQHHHHHHQHHNHHHQSDINNNISSHSRDTSPSTEDFSLKRSLSKKLKISDLPKKFITISQSLKGYNPEATNSSDHLEQQQQQQQQQPSLHTDKPLPKIPKKISLCPDKPSYTKDGYFNDSNTYTNFTPSANNNQNPSVYTTGKLPAYLLATNKFNSLLGQITENESSSSSNNNNNFPFNLGHNNLNTPRHPYHNRHHGHVKSSSSTGHIEKPNNRSSVMSLSSYNNLHLSHPDTPKSANFDPIIVHPPSTGCSNIVDTFSSDIGQGLYRTNTNMSISSLPNINSAYFNRRQKKIGDCTHNLPQGVEILSANVFAKLFSNDFLPPPLFILIDVRSFNEFAKSRLSQAINISLPTTLLKRSNYTLSRTIQSLNSFEKTLFLDALKNQEELISQNKRVFTKHPLLPCGPYGLPSIILYDNSSPEASSSVGYPSSSPKCSLSLAYMAGKFKTNNSWNAPIYVLEGGFTGIQTHYKHLLDNGDPFKSTNYDNLKLQMKLDNSTSEERQAISINQHFTGGTEEPASNKPVFSMSLDLPDQPTSLNGGQIPFIYPPPSNQHKRQQSSLTIDTSSTTSTANSISTTNSTTGGAAAVVGDNASFLTVSSYTNGELQNAYPNFKLPLLAQQTTTVPTSSSLGNLLLCLNLALLLSATSSVFSGFQLPAAKHFFRVRQNDELISMETCNEFIKLANLEKLNHEEMQKLPKWFKNAVTDDNNDGLLEKDFASSFTNDEKNNCLPIKFSSKPLTTKFDYLETQERKRMNRMMTNEAYDESVGDYSLLNNGQKTIDGTSISAPITPCDDRDYSKSIRPYLPESPSRVCGVEMGHKNRYKDILPFENTRVCLGRTRDDADADHAAAAAADDDMDDDKSHKFNPSNVDDRIGVDFGNYINANYLTSIPMKLKPQVPPTISSRTSNASTAVSGVSSDEAMVILYTNDEEEKEEEEEEEEEEKEKEEADDVVMGHDTLTRNIGQMSLEDFGNPISRIPNDVTKSPDNVAHSLKYIATQGPLTSTIGDFWYMIITENSPLIISLTEEKDGQVEKCANYWKTQSVMSTVGQLNIQELESNLLENKICGLGKNVVLRRILVDAIDLNQKHEVIQLQILNWHDLGTFVHYDELLSVVFFKRYLLQATAQYKGLSFDDNARVVVHCSAGCGRTGTFCTIDASINYELDNYGLQLSSKDDVGEKTVTSTPRVGQFSFNEDVETSNDLSGENGDIPGKSDKMKTRENDLLFDPVFANVQRFRKQRVSMVQTLRQFMLVYDTLVIFYKYLQAHSLKDFEGSGKECGLVQRFLDDWQRIEQ